MYPLLQVGSGSGEKSTGSNTQKINGSGSSSLEKLFKYKMYCIPMFLLDGGGRGGEGRGPNVLVGDSFPSAEV